MKRTLARRNPARKLVTILVSTLVMMVMSAPVSHADRGPSGSINNAQNGWVSDFWYNRQEGYNAYIWMAFCSSNPRVEVWRYQGGPGRDVFIVGEIQYCLNTTDYFYFGNLAEGTYYFKIADKRSDRPFGASYAVYH